MKRIVLLSISFLFCFTGKSRTLFRGGFVKTGIPAQGFGESQRDSSTTYPSASNVLKKYITQRQRRSARFDPGRFTGLYGCGDRSETSNFFELRPGATIFFSGSQVASINKRVAFTGSRVYA